MPRKGRISRPTAVLWGVAVLLLLAGAASRLPGAAVAPGVEGGGAAQSQEQELVAPPEDASQGVTEAPDQELLGDSARASGVGAAREDTVAPVGEQTGVRLGDTGAGAEVSLGQRLLSVVGLFVLLWLAWLLSVDRRRVPWRVVIWGLGLQLVFALFILKTPAGEAIFAGLNDVIVALLGFTNDGARFLFGNLVENAVPVSGGEPGAVAETGALFAFSVLPTIIFFSSLMTLLYYLGIMQWMVKGVAWVMMRTMRTSGAETLSAAGNIFVGQTEAPLMIKPFVERMTMSELNAVMTAGFATVAGGVLAAYVGLLVAFFPDIAGHLLAASVMSAPAALVVAKLMYPEDGEPETRSTMRVTVESEDVNAIDAAARGASEGLTLALNVGAMLLAFIALIALLNAVLGVGAGWLGLESLLRSWGALGPDQAVTLEILLGWLLAPLAWLMGVPWSDAVAVGSLLGMKTVANEFVAYLQFSEMLRGDAALSPRSIVIATYALAGFANFSSIAIQIGGIGGIAPSRRSDLSRLGLRAMIGGSLAGFMTATIAGILV